MKDSWLNSVPYGGYQKAPWGSQGAGRVGQHPSMFDEGTTTVILLGGLVVITGGAAALGWFISGTKLGALYGALGGLAYTSANLAINASAMAAELAEKRQLPQSVPTQPQPGAPGSPISVPQGYPQGGMP